MSGASGGEACVRPDGVEDDDATDTEDEPDQSAKKAVAAPQPSAEAAKQQEGKPRRSIKRQSICLKDLLDAHILRPGQGVISCEYKGNLLYGNLTHDGRLGLDGTDQLWDSPSSFSVMLKRSITPGRKADDGWTSLRYHGVLLDLLKKRFSEGLGPLDKASLDRLAGPSRKRAAPASAAGPRQSKRKRAETARDNIRAFLNDEEWERRTSAAQAPARGSSGEAGAARRPGALAQESGAGAAADRSKVAHSRAPAPGSCSYATH